MRPVPAAAHSSIEIATRTTTVWRRKSSVCACPEGLYTAPVSGDCDDTTSAVHPGATELCNDKDDNCNGTADEPGATGCQNYYRDVDKDQYGITTDVLCLCTSTGDYVTKKSGDCNDANALQNPDMVEKCDDIDNNCTLGIDEACDGDDDSYWQVHDAGGWHSVGVPAWRRRLQRRQ